MNHKLQGFALETVRPHVSHMVRYMSYQSDAVRQLHNLFGAFEQAVISGITIHLQDAAEALQDTLNLPFPAISFCCRGCFLRYIKVL